MSQPSTTPGNLPAAWARGKQSKMARWASGEVGSRLRAFAPQVFPGVPPGVWYGFMANGGENEDTATAARHARFHELGMFGTTGGPWDVPAPNSNTSAENDWHRYHADPRVRGMLGRDACMSPEGCWRGDRGGIADQVAVGLVSMRDKANARSLPASIRPTNPLSPWGILASSATWSAGGGRLARHLAPYADRIAQVPDVASDRFIAWGRMLADDLVSGRVAPGPSGEHENPAHSFIRTRQKLAASSAVDPESAAFFAWSRYPDLDAIDSVLSHAALGHDVRGMSLPPSGIVRSGPSGAGASGSMGTTGSAVAAVASLAVAGAVAWWWLRGSSGRGGSTARRRGGRR